MARVNLRNQSFLKYPFSHIVAHLAGQRMLEKFDWIRWKPHHILVLGISSGEEVKALRQRFSTAEITVLDSDFQRVFQETVADFKICANLAYSALRAGSFDCILSNCCLHHVADLRAWMKIVWTLLQPGGLFLFSGYGPLTLSELQTAFARIDDYPHAADFFDMHDLGDVLKTLAYENPVMEQEVLTLTYTTLLDLVRDLRSSGEVNQHERRRRALMTPRQWRLLTEAYEVFRNESGRLVSSVELCYGVGWKSAKGTAGLEAGAQEIKIPLSVLLKTKKSAVPLRSHDSEDPKG